MRFKARYFFLILFCVVLLHCATYNWMTHLFPHELAWINHYNVDDTAYFISPKGDVDTMVIIETCIYNSLNPFVNPGYKFELSDTYEAGGFVEFYVRHGADSLYGDFIVDKIFIFNLLVHSGFADRIDLDINLQNIQEETVTAGGITYPDALVFDDKCTHLRSNPEYEIKSYTWSKSVGLVQYVFGDGTVYNRAPDEKTKNSFKQKKKNRH